MRRSTSRVALATLAFAALSLGARSQPPDYSGTWVASTDPPATVAAAPSPMMGPRLRSNIAGRG